MNDLQTIGVAGLGLLGRGIAACCLAHGFHVIAFTRRRETHDAADRYIQQATQDLVNRAGFPPPLRDQWRSRYEPVTALDAFSPCAFVIETVLEDLEVKRRVFDELETTIDENTPIASNTSALPITCLQQGRQHPHRFVGMHWAEPAHATRFCELIRGEWTSDKTFQTAAALAKRLGKEPSLVRKDVPGFIVNRIGYAMYREAMHLVATGVADIETIDRSCRNALGLWATFCGPFRWMDLTGGAALYAKAMSGVLPSLCNATELPEFMRNHLERGEPHDEKGTAGDRGFYPYAPGEREKWEHLFREHAWLVRKLHNQYYPTDTACD